jgi:hypothetical protein
LGLFEAGALVAEGGGFEAEAVEADEAGGVVLIVGFAGVGFHGGDVFAVEAEGGLASGGHDVAFVEFQSDLTGDGFLAFGDEGLQGVALGGEPEAVVDELGVFGDEGVAQGHDFAVHGEAFDLAMANVKDGTAGGFVDAAAFHADEAVFDHVDAADAVATAEAVEQLHDAEGGVEGVAVLLSDRGDAEGGGEFGEFGVLEADGVAFFEEDFDVFGFVRGVFGGNGEDVHVTHFGDGAIEPGVFQHAAFEADVEEVAVHGVGLLDGSGDGDALLFGIGDHFGATGELGAEVFHAPGGHDFEFGGEGGGGEFEADLVVAFAGGAVGEGVAVFSAGDVDHAFGDDGAGDAGAEEVLAFIDGSGLEHGEDEVAGEFFAEVADDAFAGTGGEGFFFEAVELFFLADIGAVGDDFGVIGLLEPLEENGGVETTGIGEDDFLFHRL